MDWINDSDWNAQARVEGSDGLMLDAHLRGYADSVSLEQVPGPSGNELLVLFRAEAGYTGAALRVRDILAATLEHYPELWNEVRDQASKAAESCDVDD